MTLIYQNLVGKEFDPGKEDCFSTVINFFDQNFGIKIPNFARPSDWSADTLNLIDILYKQTGFKKLTDYELRPCDVLATAINSHNPNHFVIYLGNNEILHHLYNTISSVDPYRNFWKMNTCYILRHPDVPNLEPDYPEVSIQEILKKQFSFPKVEGNE